MSYRKCFTVNEALKSLPAWAMGEDEADFLARKRVPLKIQINMKTGTMTRGDQSEHYHQQRVNVDAEAELWVVKAAPRPSQAT